MPLDVKRYIFSLTGRLLRGGWGSEKLRRALREAEGARALRVPGLVERILLSFPMLPEYGALADFLQKDAGLLRAAARQAASAGESARASGKMGALPRRMQGVTLPEIRTEAALAEWLGVSLPQLQWLADVNGRNRRHERGPLRTYRYRWIARRGGPPRLLEIPKYRLKELQRMILREILGGVPLHESVHGFCAGRSIVSNAQHHCGKECVLRFDLADFFPSVTSARIFRIFRTLGYPASVARLLTGICTTRVPANVWEARPGARLGEEFEVRQHLIGRHLPQGAPTSPALANLAAHRLDRRLSGLAAKNGATYTRYADDLTFSGGADLARARRRLEVLVGEIAIAEGFQLNFRKTRFMGAGVRQQVAGVVVNVRPNIRRVDFDRLKAILTNCARHGPASQNRGGVTDFRAHLAGKVAQVASIHPSRGKRLKQLFDLIKWEC